MLSILRETKQVLRVGSETRQWRGYYWVPAGLDRSELPSQTPVGSFIDIRFSDSVRCWSKVCRNAMQCCEWNER